MKDMGNKELDISSGLVESKMLCPLWKEFAGY